MPRLPSSFLSRLWGNSVPVGPEIQQQKENLTAYSQTFLKLLESALRMLKILVNKAHTGSPFCLLPDAQRQSTLFDPNDIFLRLTANPHATVYSPPNNILATDSYSDDFEAPDQSLNSVEPALTGLAGNDNAIDSDFPVRTKQVTLQVLDEDSDMEDASMIEHIDSKER